MRRIAVVVVCLTVWWPGQAWASKSDILTPPAILQKIKACESHGDYRADNPGSSASGAYQLLDPTWRQFRGREGRRWGRAKYAPRYVQDLVALRLWRAIGTRPWNASRGCWGHG